MTILLLWLSLVLQAAPATEAKGPTPDQALKTFLIAMLTRDIDTLRRVTIKHDEFDVLTTGPAVPEKEQKFFKDFIQAQTFRSLKPGDEVTLPGGKKSTVAADEVGDDRAVLLVPGAPLPHRLQKIDGQWRVDAASIIVARKAAAAARDK